MSDTDTAPLIRLSTGIPGVDTVLHGGLFKGGIYIVSGVPGSGKTIFANQICSHFVASGRRALYVTLLAETHARMLAQMQSLSFFDSSKIGTQLKYLNGFTVTENEGLEGLLALVRGAVREHKADLLVLDGMITAGALARSPVDYKKFINELQTWVAMLGCTVLFLTSTAIGVDRPTQPEHTIVDGIFEMGLTRGGITVERRFSVTKLRASGFIEGVHNYVIRDDGITVFPRLEAATHPRPAGREPSIRQSTGVAGLDKMIGGGVAQGTCSLLLGPSGSGKTFLGLQFLMHGIGANERAVHYGFFERPRDLCAKAERVGLPVLQEQEAGNLELLWHPPSEVLLDKLGYEILAAVDRTGATRLFLDGLAGLQTAAPIERIPGFFSTLVEELASRGVTLMISEETRELFVQEVEIPTPGVSAIFHNIFFLRHMETGNRLDRMIAVMKTRDSAHDHRYHTLEIGKGGVTVGKPLKGNSSLAHGRTVRSGGLLTRRRRR